MECRGKTGNITLFFSYNKLSSFSDLRIVEILHFSEQVCGQKPTICNFSDGYVGNSRRYSLTIKVTVSKNKEGDLLSYLRYGVFPNDIRRVGYVPTDWNGYSYNWEYAFKNWSTFSGFGGIGTICWARIRVPGDCGLIDWVMLNGLSYRI